MSRLIQKVLYALVTIFVALTTIFFVIRLSPGDPVETVLGQKATQEEISKLKTQLGLDLPMSSQYINYLTGMTKGDLGKTIFGNKDVKELLKERMKPTIILAAISVTLAAIVGIFLGIWAGFKKNKNFDKFSRLISLFALSFPIFSLAPLMVLIFSIKLNLLPVSEWGSLKHMILPIITLIIPLSAIVMRVTRNKYLEEVHSQWVMVTRSKGMGDIPILLRILKVCLPTILNVVSIQLSVVIAGTMITETIFDIPGMGSLLFDGIQNRDYPIVQGVIVYSTVTYMLIYFLIDFINEKLDPRMQG
ncbi:MAG: ABC transporter permease [Bdellovibrionales bacterium]|nr:ABC transporter permease [Bdellovibrionales bacterium]